MVDEKTTPALAFKSDNGDFQLTAQERLLILKYRASNDCAKNMILDFCEELSLTFPAA